METLESVEMESQAKMPRPTFLTVLCILTFIMTGLSILSGLTVALTGPPSDERIKEDQVEMLETVEKFRELDMLYWADVMEKMGKMQEEVSTNYMANGLVNLGLGIFGLFAALYMWKGKKIGFHFYIMYSILSIVSIYLIASAVNVTSFYIIFNVVLALIFVFMYSRNLKWLS